MVTIAAKIVRRALDHSDFATVPMAIAGCLAIWPARDAAAPEVALGVMRPVPASSPGR